MVLLQRKQNEKVEQQLYYSFNRQELVLRKNGIAMTNSHTESTSYFLHLDGDDVKIFGLNAAAILSVIKAGEKWRSETNFRNKKANDVAEMHGDSRWLPENVSLRFTNQDFLDRTFGICGRNGVVEAIKLLESKRVISQEKNSNKKYSSDKGRYFRFHQGVYDVCLAEFKQGKVVALPREILAENPELHEASSDETTQANENIDRLELNDGPFNSKRQEEILTPKINGPHPKINSTRLNLNGDHLKINAPRLNSVAHIRNSNNINKNIINNLINAREKKTFSSNEELINNNQNVCKNLEQSDDQLFVSDIIQAILSLGFSYSKINTPDAISILKDLKTRGANVEVFTKAHAISSRATKGKSFNLTYLSKAVESLLDKANNATENNTNSDYKKYQKPVHSEDEFFFEENLENARSWAGDLI